MQGLGCGHAFQGLQLCGNSWSFTGNQGRLSKRGVTRSYFFHTADDSASKVLNSLQFPDVLIFDICPNIRAGASLNIPVTLLYKSVIKQVDFELITHRQHLACPQMFFSFFFRIGERAKANTKFLLLSGF